MEKSWNKLLLRQINRKYGSPDQLSPDHLEFLTQINETYSGFEDDIRLLQHSIEISSIETREAYLRQKQDAETQKKFIARIREAITALNPQGDQAEMEHEITDNSQLFDALIRLIGERKQMEKSLIESEFYLREILDSQDVGVVIIDAETHEILFINKKAADLYGQPKEKIIGTTREWRICPTNCGECELINHKQSLKSAERVFLTKDRTEIPVLKSVVHSSFNGRKSLVESFVEISQLKLVEAELIKAKNMAETASSAKSEFLANMSHEIRTPLNGVIGFVDLLMKTKLNETQLHYMQTVYYSANSLLDLINDILDFSKIESGKFELNPERTDLIELAEQICDILKYRASEKQIEMLLNLPAQMPRFVETDSVRLRQVLVNLMGNAFKFTEKGEVELKIEVGPIHPVSHEAEFTFSVRDTGIGIPKDKLKKIFESFSQADSSITRKYGGTGLGLTISHKLVEMMGGKLELESESGLGSRFYFTLHLKAEHGEAVDQQDLSNIKKVLVVDDNKNNRQIISEMLRTRQIITIQASDGAEALTLLSKDPHFDVIIMDYHMPDLSGIEVIRLIREKYKIPMQDQPVIFLHSSSDNEKIYEESRRLGVRHMMMKPVKMQQLFTALSNIHTFTEARPQQSLPPVLLTERKELSKKPFQILITEDNKINMMLASTIVRNLLPKAEIRKAENGKVAVEKVRENVPNLIFMDIQMPELNGYEASQHIRSLDNAQQVPIVALTAGTVKGEEERCREAGMNDYITKPVVEETISRMLKKWLRLEPEIPGLMDSEGLSAVDHFDINKLNERIFSEEAVFSAILQDATDQVPWLIQEIKLSFLNRDCDRIRLNANLLNQISIVSCLPRLALLANTIQNSDKNENEKVSLLIHNLQQEWNHTLILLNKYL